MNLAARLPRGQRLPPAPLAAALTGPRRLRSPPRRRLAGRSSTHSSLTTTPFADEEGEVELEEKEEGEGEKDEQEKGDDDDEQDDDDDDDDEEGR